MPLRTSATETSAGDWASLGAGLPRVVLKGSGRLADEIVEAGRRQRPALPLVEDELLLDALYRLPTDAEIGRDLFELVAALLAHVYAVDAHRQEEMP